MKEIWRTQKAWILGVAAVLLVLSGWLAIRYLVPRPVFKDMKEVRLGTVEHWDEEVVLNEAAEQDILNILSELRCTRAFTWKGFLMPEDRAVCLRVYAGSERMDIYLGEDSVIQIWSSRWREGYYRVKNPQEAEERLTAILEPLLPETTEPT